MRQNSYEILLSSGGIDATKWREFLRAIAEYLKLGDKWRLSVLLDGVTLRYYLETPRPLPPSLGLADFLLKQAVVPPAPVSPKPGLLSYYHHGDDCLDLVRRLSSRQHAFQRVVLEFRAFHKTYVDTSYLFYSYRSMPYVERLAGGNAAKILAVDFSKNKHYAFKKFPKYLKSEKNLKLMQNHPDHALFEIDSFPYRVRKQFLGQAAYDFDKHSLVLGGSGSGKSKFLASFIDQIYQTAPDRYKIVVIDPHDALKNDCRQIPSRTVVNFCQVERSINLFQNNIEDANISVELTLTLFQSLMGADYNTQLERVLRFASYLLMSTGQFSFLRLRRLLTDLEFCNQTVSQYADQLPDAVSRFFLADFSELRTKSYAVAIAPIIAFIDEMQMVPVFNQDAQLPSLSDNLQNNFLSIYSLSRPKLGQKVVQTIAGLLLQQLFLFAQRKTIDQHLIVIIDEVATIENPILARFLSELRKFQTSLVLAGQYFDQFSPALREAIFANAANYYIFRVSKRDAELLVKNLEIKLASSDKVEDQQAVLTTLKDRECLVQVSKSGELYPACKARTLDFSPVPLEQDPPKTTPSPAPIVPQAPEIPPAPEPVLQLTQPPHSFEFSLDANAIRPEDVMRASSTSRKKIKEQNA